MLLSLNRRNTKKYVTILCLVLGTSFIAAEAFAWQRNISRTGPQGHTMSRSINVTGTADGYTRNRTLQGPQGGSMSKDVTATRTANGYTRQSTLTGPQGNTATRSASGQWDPSTNTWTKSVTTQGGN